MAEDPNRICAANSSIGTVVACVIISLLIATVAIIALLLWLRKRVREPVMMNNVAYHRRNTEIMTDVTTSHRRVSANISAATVTGETATSVSTSPNPAYQPVEPPQENVDIATATNMAYVATDIATHVNSANQPINNNSNLDKGYNYAIYRPVADSKLEYDYPRL